VVLGSSKSRDYLSGASVASGWRRWRPQKGGTVPNAVPPSFFGAWPLNPAGRFPACAVPAAS